jgi:hypothetical protein
MIKVLHYYPKDDTLTSRYVTLLIEAMSQRVESEVADSPVVFRKKCKDWHPDIVHIYGDIRCATTCRRVVSPCGTPFNHHQPYYAVIARSPMEAEELQEQGFKRVEIIRNPLITKTTDIEEMANKMAYVYQKVMDSNPLPFMDETTRDALSIILKVALCGDKRWVAGQSVHADNINFRTLFIYGELEGILLHIHKGLQLLDIKVPPYQKTACYLPDYYKIPMSTSKADIATQLSDIRSNGLTVLKLCNLFESLYDKTLDEDELINKLESENNLSLFKSLLFLEEEILQLDQGFMPCAPIENSETRKLRKDIYNHLQL